MWKKIQGHNYSVSDRGNVRNDKTNKLLNPWQNSYGYPTVTLWRQGKAKRIPVHRLVAEAFIPNPQNYPVVDHINTEVRDNRVENLRWTTYAGNSNNPITLSRLRRTTFKNGDANPKTMTGKIGKLNPVSRPIVQLSHGEIIAYHDCARRAMIATGIDCGSITKVCRGQRKTAGGFQWQYKTEK